MQSRMSERWKSKSTLCELVRVPIDSRMPCPATIYIDEVQSIMFITMIKCMLLDS